MTIVRLLQANRRRTVVLDHDAEQIEALRKFGYRVYYGDAGRLDLLEAAGAKEAKVFVLAIDDRDRALLIAASVLRHFPHLRVFARAFDRVHAYQLLNLGVHSVYREVFGTSVDVGARRADGARSAAGRRAARGGAIQGARRAARARLGRASPRSSEARRHLAHCARRDRERARAATSARRSPRPCAPTPPPNAAKANSHSARSRRRSSLDTSATFDYRYFCNDRNYWICT